ncbi:MAG: hypothetical protein HOP34_13465 [Methylococcaceae bacterium]|nr:hypothetical protein [Methylococcaceae bacterium]
MSCCLACVLQTYSKDITHWHEAA